MRVISFITSAFVFLYLAATGWAFQIGSPAVRQQVVSSRLFSSPSRDSTSPEDTTLLGPTEKILIEAVNKKKNIQEYGRTVKNDGLDGVRALVWGLFHMSQVVFTGLGVLLSLGLLLNIMGMGYYFDADGQLVVDSLEHLQRERMLQEEALRLAKESGAWVK